MRKRSEGTIKRQKGRKKEIVIIANTGEIDRRMREEGDNKNNRDSR